MVRLTANAGSSPFVVASLTTSWTILSWSSLSFDQKLPFAADDPDTRDIYQPVRVLCQCGHDKNLRDFLVKSHLNNTTASVKDRDRFPCGRSWCNTCAHTNASSTINTPGGHVTINSKFTCTSSNVVYLIKCRTCNKVYIGETGRRLGDRFREH